MTRWRAGRRRTVTRVASLKERILRRGAGKLALVLAVAAASGGLLARAIATAGSGGPEPTELGGLADRPAEAPESGKWRRARTPPEPEAEEALAVLLANPYLQGYRAAREAAWVTRYDPERTEPGLNLYVSGHAPEAVLMDLEGRVLHRWRHRLEALWPDLYRGPTAESIRKVEYWRRAQLLPNGDLLAIYEGLGVVRLDARSRLVWAYRGGAHHDLFLDPEQGLWVLDRRAVRLPRIHPHEHVLEDLVTLLDPDDGTVRRQISLLEAFERSPYAQLLEAMPARGDLLHTNTLKPLGEEALAIDHPAFRPGNLLLSVLELDALAILDPGRAEVVWATTGSWRRQHEPMLLPEGRILLFDNLGLGDRSRVIEIDPLSAEVLWSYPEQPRPDLLFSKTLGTSRRLDNGNTLITESENGRALEVTRDGEVVWEFFTPHRAGEGNALVATLFEVERVSAELGWLRTPGLPRRPPEGSKP